MVASNARSPRLSGLDKEIQELIEAVVLPMTHKHMFDNIGIRPPKGILLHGPPGTGKTLLARACAKQTDAIFLKLAGPQLVQVRLVEALVVFSRLSVEITRGEIEKYSIK